MTLALLWDDFGVTLGCRYRQAAAVSPLLTVAAAALPPPPERTFDEGLEQFCPKGALFAEAPQARQELFPRTAAMIVRGGVILLLNNVNTVVLDAKFKGLSETSVGATRHPTEHPRPRDVGPATRRPGMFYEDPRARVEHSANVLEERLL